MGEGEEYSDFVPPRFYHGIGLAIKAGQAHPAYSTRATLPYSNVCIEGCGCVSGC